MSASHKRFFGLVFVALIPVGVIAYVLSMRGDPIAPAQPSVSNEVTTQGQSNDQESLADTILVGGVKRPKSDVAFHTAALSAERSKLDAATKKLLNKGSLANATVPIASRDENKQISKVHESILARSNPERYHTLALSAAFDNAAFDADPDAYLSTVEPARVWQTAQPGPDVPALTGLSRPRQSLKENEAIRLRVRSAANAPVTFTTLDSGVFENSLPSISVRADKDGIAEAKYSAISGVVGDVNIIAASPLASGSVKYRLSVIPTQP
jgi:hypothetical protein